MSQKQTPKIDQTKLSPEQRDRLEGWKQQQDQLKVLQDIADMTQEVVSVIDEQKENGEKFSKDLGPTLLDIRESLQSLNEKEAPEAPDYAKPVVEAVSKLEKALTSAVKGIDTKPVVNMPATKVEAADVDLSGVERILKSDIPKAFADAVAAMPRPEKPDNSKLLKAWEGISEQLVSIENATRMKPLPGKMIVTNSDGSSVGSTSSKATGAYSICAISDDGTYRYFWFEDSSSQYYIMRKHKVNKVFSYARGVGGYQTVYQSSSLGPSSASFNNYGSIF